MLTICCLWTTKPSFFARLCNVGAGRCKQASFASWCNARLCQQRVLEGHRKACEEALPVLAPMCLFISYRVTARSLQTPSPTGALSSEFSWHPADGAPVLRLHLPVPQGTPPSDGPQPRSPTRSEPHPDLRVFLGSSPASLEAALLLDFLYPNFP